MRKFIITALSTVTLLGITAPIASASFMDTYDAADQVERVAHKRYHIDPLAFCRKLGHGRFTCTISDFKGSCSYDGRANVHKYGSYRYVVTSMHVSKSCF